VSVRTPQNRANRSLPPWRDPSSSTHRRLSRCPSPDSPSGQNMLASCFRRWLGNFPANQAPQRRLPVRAQNLHAQHYWPAQIMKISPGPAPPRLSWRQVSRTSSVQVSIRGSEPAGRVSGNSYPARGTSGGEGRGEGNHSASMIVPVPTMTLPPLLPQYVFSVPLLPLLHLMEERAGVRRGNRRKQEKRVIPPSAIVAAAKHVQGRRGAR